MDGWMGLLSRQLPLLAITRAGSSYLIDYDSPTLQVIHPSQNFRSCSYSNTHTYKGVLREYKPFYTFIVRDETRANCKKNPTSSVSTYLSSTTLPR